MKQVIVDAALLSGIFLTGCTSMKVNGAPTTSKSLDQPPIGQVNTAYVGESMLSQGRLIEQNVLVVNALIDGFAYDIPPESYTQVGYDLTNDYLSAMGVSKNQFADPFTGMAFDKQAGSQMCVITVFGGKVC